MIWSVGAFASGYVSRGVAARMAGLPVIDSGDLASLIRRAPPHPRFAGLLRSRLAPRGSLPASYEGDLAKSPSLRMKLSLSDQHAPRF